MRNILIIFFVCCAEIIFAQPASLTDSLRRAFDAEPTYTVRLDTRNSFITGRSARIRGVKAGVTHNKIVGYGLGFNWLASDFNQVYHYKLEGAEFETEAELRYFYFSPYFDYTFYQKNNWFVTIPVQMGFGWSNLKYESIDGTTKRTPSEFMITYEPAMSVEYRFLKYFGVGAGVGFRLMLLNKDASGYEFNSPVYLLKFRVMFSKIYKEMSSGE